MKKKARDISKENLKIITNQIMKYKLSTKIILILTIFLLTLFIFFLFINKGLFTGAVIGLKNSYIKYFIFPFIFLIFLSLVYQRRAKSEEEIVSKVITGLNYRNPKMADRLLQDKHIVREKYGLPDPEMKYDDPKEYVIKLEKIARDNGIKIVRDETKNRGGGFYDTDEKVVVIDRFNGRGEEITPTTYANLLVHELVHGLQFEKYPNMPIEQKEYEASLAMGTHRRKTLKDPKIREGLFGLIANSVSHWNTQKKKANSLK